MGTDIHMVLERKSGDKWIGIDTFLGHTSALNKGYTWPEASERNYRRFAALASVRGDGPKARGLPFDISDTSKLLVEDWGTDGHHHSWLPLDEAAQVFLQTDFNRPDEFARKHPSAYYFAIDSEGSAPAYRIVFWFDN